MKTFALIRLFVVCSIAIAFTGCSYIDPHYISHAFDDLAQTGTPIPRANAAAPKVKRLVLQAKIDFPLQVVSLVYNSTGPFKAQMRVAFGPLKGLRSGQSMAFLRLNEADGFDYYTIAGRYLDTNGGSFFAVPSATVGSAGLPIFYDSSHEVDLQIEQTATELTLASREPIDLGGDGVWHVHKSFTRSPENQFFLSLGIMNVDKKARFYFSDFRLSGAGIGGAVEGAISKHLQDATDAIRAAQTKLKAQPADLTGAATDLDTALSEGTAGGTALNDAITGATLQSTKLGKRARLLLAPAIKKVKATQKVVARHKPKEVRAAASGLNAAAGNLEGAMGNLLGSKTPNLKSKPQIFTWHTD